MWNRTHKAAVSKQVTIKRNPFEMRVFCYFAENWERKVLYHSSFFITSNKF